MSPPLISAQGPIPCPGLPRVQCGISKGRQRMGFEGTQSDLAALQGGGKTLLVWVIEGMGQGTG